MNLKQLEDLLSSACNTYACLVRAQTAIERIKVTKKVRESLGVVYAASEAMKHQASVSLRATAQAVYELSDQWGEHLSLIRGTRIRLSTLATRPASAFEGIYQGIIPDEATGNILVLISAEAGGPSVWKLTEAIHTLHYGTTKKPKVPPTALREIVPDIEHYFAVAIPVHMARRRGMVIEPT